MTQDDVDVSSAVAAATGTSPEPSSPSDAPSDSSGSSSSTSSASTLWDALMSTEPEQRLERVESPWAPDLGGDTRIYRGIQKMTNVEGTPAVVDVTIGLLEVVVGRDFNFDTGDDGREQEASDGLGGIGET